MSRPVLLCLALLCAACGATRASTDASAVGPLVHLPRDTAGHPAVGTEWWYVVGHLRAGLHTFGYEATAFRFSHVHVPGAVPGSPALTLYRTDIAITDESGKRFHQKVTYYFPQSASISTRTMRLHVGHVALTGATPQRMSLAASLPGGSFELNLHSQRPVMNVGGRGYLSFADGYTYYYSLTDLATTGTLMIGGTRYAVTGTSWLDHQWGTWTWANVQGWTWMALQLSNGVQLSLFDFRTAQQRTRAASILGNDTRLRTLHELTITPHGHWISPHTGGNYPSGWTVRIPGAGALLNIQPTVLDQELLSPSQPQGSYWEGSGRVTGTWHGKAVAGKSYTELTGYATRSRNAKSPSTRQ